MFKISLAVGIAMNQLRRWYSKQEQIIKMLPVLINTHKQHKETLMLTRISRVRVSPKVQWSEISQKMIPSFQLPSYNLQALCCNKLYKVNT